MCGIAGMVGGPAPDLAMLERMAGCMAHRGPDGQDVWSDGEAGLAFRRLAIIDLDERSMQPLHFERWHLVFNGEIYNYRELRVELEALGHRFVTAGDGEVLLHAWAHWGEDALKRLNGMFAFAIWNDEHRELVLAADPFGEKPLYWCRDGARLVFASDIRALRAAVPSLGAPDEDALAAFVALGALPAVDRSFLLGIERLPGASLLRFADGRLTLRRYWSPSRVAVPTAYADAVEMLREILTDSVRLRLRSDVAVGTSLSGGVDSSSVVALASQLEPTARRHAFTASFPGFARDEWEMAQVAARRAAVVEHHRVVVTGEEMLADLDKLILDQEEPFGSLSIYAQWRVYRAAFESGVTVLLDGQGGDELFAGYPGTIGWTLRARGPRALVTSFVRGRPGSRSEILRAVGAERAPRAVIAHHRRRLASAYASTAAVDSAIQAPSPAPAGGEGNPLRRELLRQTFHTSLPGLLRYADRDSMAHSREVRLPLLDRRVAEFAFSCPPGYLVDGEGVTKRILRDAVAGLVPREILAQRDKIGFEPPQSAWLAAPAAVELARTVLLDPSARSRGLYDLSALEADLQRGRPSDPSGLWRALNAELWLRSGIVSQ